MIALASLAVVASVLGLQGDSARLDKGLIDGLGVGDQGSVFYTLTVNSRPKRIDVGRARIVQVDDFSSMAVPIGSVVLRVGYSMELDPPPGRTSPEALLEIANRRLGDRDYEAALGYFEKIRQILPDDPLIERKLAETQSLLAGGEWRDQERKRLDYYRLAARSSLDEGDLRSAQSFVRKILRLQPDDEVGLEIQTRLRLLDRTARMIRVPDGQYWIGADLREARFYNQQPRWSATLGEFWIDRRPVGRRELTAPADPSPSDQPGPVAVGVSYAEADRYCRSRGKRLPTELEWEAAAYRSGFERAEGISEWTSSWYRPYPGNKYQEKEYGEDFRVVKGFSEEGEFDPRLRFYMTPGEKALDIGFRCAMDRSSIQ